MKRFFLVVLAVLAMAIGVSAPSFAEQVLQTELVTAPQSPLDVRFVVNGRWIAISVLNATSDTAQIVWDETALVDNRGTSHRVVHTGVRYIQIGMSQAPSVVAPGARLEDTIYSIDSIGRSVNDIRPFLVSPQAGQQFGLSLAVKMGDRSEHLNYVFQVTRVINTKSSVVAGTLAFFFPTTGHLYAGDWTRGFVYGIPRIALMLYVGGQSSTESEEKSPSLGVSLASVAWLVLTVAEIRDATKLVDEYNKRALGISFDPSSNSVMLSYAF